MQGAQRPPNGWGFRPAPLEKGRFGVTVRVPQPVPRGLLPPLGHTRSRPMLQQRGALGLTTGGAPGGQRAAAGAMAYAGRRQRKRLPGCREDPGRPHVVPKKSSRGARVRHALGPSDAARSFKGQHPSVAVASPAPQCRRDADVGVTQPALATGGTLFPRQRVRPFLRRNGSPSRVSVRQTPTSVCSATVAPTAACTRRRARRWRSSARRGTLLSMHLCWQEGGQNKHRLGI